MSEPANFDPAAPPLSLAMLGRVDGNGHPWSWSAILNGYDREAMAACPFPAIPAYLNPQPDECFPLPGARVTHVWMEDVAEARLAARATNIPEVVSAPEEVIGAVDAVVIATDIGHEHVARCRPFVEAGLPVFVDKPLVDRAEDLNQFRAWRAQGARILSSSCMRYAKEYLPYHGGGGGELGELRLIQTAMCKTWARYGIHALEGIFPIPGPGFVSVRNIGREGRDFIQIRHASGVEVQITLVPDAYGAFGTLTLGGTAGSAQVKMTDMFTAFRAQLTHMVDWLHTGRDPFPFSETEELMRLLIAGIQSVREGGREIFLEEIP